MDAKEFLRLKDEIDKMKRDLAKAEGALEQGLAQLQKEFGCSNEEEAGRFLASMEKGKKQLQQEYEEKVAAYKELWGGRLE